jgi:hypothetical protein
MPDSRDASRGAEPRMLAAARPDALRDRDPWPWFMTLWELGWQRASGAAAMQQRAHDRLVALAGYARAHSPLYGDAYRGLPVDDVTLADLPVMHKASLMSRFDDWVTDAAVRRTGVDRFLADRAHVGDRYLGRYLVWKSSSSTGEPGIFVQDAAAPAVYDALIAVQLSRLDLAVGCGTRMLRGGRAARQRRLGHRRAGGGRPPPDATGRDVAHGAHHQSRQSRAADHPLRPGRRRRCASRPLRVRQPAAGDPAAGPQRRRRHRDSRTGGCARS